MLNTSDILSGFKSLHFLLAWRGTQPISFTELPDQQGSHILALAETRQYHTRSLSNTGPFWTPSRDSGLYSVTDYQSLALKFKSFATPKTQCSPYFILMGHMNLPKQRLTVKPGLFMEDKEVKEYL